MTTTGSAIGFTGHVNDPDTDLVYMQQRYYDPIAGRFLSVDPVVTDANTGGSFNRYTYANNSPYSYTDPDGRNPVDPFSVVPPRKQLGVRLFDLNLLIEAYNRLRAREPKQNESADAPKPGKARPDKIVGVKDGKGGTQGGRENNGPLAPENGGTGDAAADFDHLTGGISTPAPEGSGYPPGTLIGENDIALRPDGKNGPRIDIPAEGKKPHETLHYPKKDP